MDDGGVGGIEASLGAPIVVSSPYAVLAVQTMKLLLSLSAFDLGLRSGDPDGDCLCVRILSRALFLGNILRSQLSRFAL